MEKKTPQEIQEELSKPFAPADMEWRLQMTFEEKMTGIAVPYVTNRAIQNRLDSVVGAENWCNEFKPWHGSGKKEAQICGISIYFEDRGWITKWDGAEDSDIEPVKGGLSDSMKRAAVQWGIGRVLYNMDTVFVNIEKRGKTFLIKKEERTKLDKTYLDLLRSLNLTPAPAGGVQSELIGQTSVGAESSKQPMPTQQQSKPTPAQQPKQTPEPQPNKEAPKVEFTVASAKTQTGMSGVSTSLSLVDENGRKTIAFVRGEHPELRNGAKLFNVKKQFRQQDSVAFYLLDSFEIADEAA